MNALRAIRGSFLALAFLLIILLLNHLHLIRLTALQWHEYRPQNAPLTPAQEPLPSGNQQEATTPVDDSYLLENSITPSDVLLMIKTGGRTFWSRMPVQLATTLRNHQYPNHIVYSDLTEEITSDLQSIDVLENFTDIVKRYDKVAYASYVDLRSTRHINTYQEHVGLPGDQPPSELPGNSPGWQLDRYKFLPLLMHAQKNWPNLKWYVYIEDDTFIFLSNVLHWLSRLSPDEEPSYYGYYSGQRPATFAQGGSGIVFSRSLMQSVFGGNVNLLEKYANQTSTDCCGDIALGNILRDNGIQVNRGFYGPASFQPEAPWKTGFDQWVWCYPIFTFHHLHQRDLAELGKLERIHESTTPERPILFRDIFMHLIAAHLVEPELSDWDNFASKYTFGEVPSSEDPPSSSFKGAEFQEAFSSPKTCQTACAAHNECLSWRYDGIAKICALDTTARLGREVDPSKPWQEPTDVISGWMLERIKVRLIDNKCEKAKNVWIPGDPDYLST